MPNTTNHFSFVPAPATPAQAPMLTIEQAMATATQLQAQGRLQESEQLLQQILQRQPQHAFALHLLGVIAHLVGKQEIAADLIQKAIQINGDVALFHSNLCEVLRHLKRYEEALLHGERAVALIPEMAMAHSNLGIIYFDRKDYARAEQCQQRALEIDAKLAPALNNLGSIYRERKDKKVALDYYQQAIAANAQYLEALNNYGALILEDDRIDEAAESLNKALQINPNYAEAICNMGGVHLAREAPETALSFFQRALALRPVYIEAQMGLAKTWQALENLANAKTTALDAIQIDINNPKAHALLASIHVELTCPEQAEQEYETALTLDAECDEALLGLGHLCMEIGQMDRAEKLFNQALAYQPDNLSARLHLTQLKKVTLDDENFVALLEEEQKSADYSENKKMSLHYALGKCYDDSRAYDKAFPHFLAGSKIKRAKLTYDPATATQQFEQVMALFDQTYIDHWRGAGDMSDLPVFVLGMPRSGTTLTEQIIASHPQVYGAGELHDLLRIAGQSIGTPTLPSAFPNNLAELNREALTAWGKEYVTGLKQRAPKALRITDKMPANFFAVGFIHLMLPNAKIIHVKRNSVDTCLSCYTRLFQRKQEHTYDLAELGAYYANYARLMAHWRKVLPEGAFLDVQYEDIVADKEIQARRLINYCGLDWDAACLDFHQTQRSIRTASITQVRQPIYTSSVERWRNYEKFLSPLLDALGELNPSH